MYKKLSYRGKKALVASYFLFSGATFLWQIRATENLLIPIPITLLGICYLSLGVLFPLLKEDSVALSYDENKFAKRWKGIITGLVLYLLMIPIASILHLTVHSLIVYSPAAICQVLPITVFADYAKFEARFGTTRSVALQKELDPMLRKLAIKFEREGDLEKAAYAYYGLIVLNRKAKNPKRVRDMLRLASIDYELGHRSCAQEWFEASEEVRNYCNQCKTSSCKHRPKHLVSAAHVVTHYSEVMSGKELLEDFPSLKKYWNGKQPKKFRCDRFVSLKRRIKNFSWYHKGNIQNVKTVQAALSKYDSENIPKELQPVKSLHPAVFNDEVFKAAKGEPEYTRNICLIPQRTVNFIYAVLKDKSQ